MAKAIRCREVGFDCDFEARADTVEELLQKCNEHAKTGDPSGSCCKGPIGSSGSLQDERSEARRRSVRALSFFPKLLLI